jgi:hypothetical protein
MEKTRGQKSRDRVPLTSVAEPELEPEPEPVEQQLFAGAGAKVFLARLWLRSRACKFSSNVTKTLNLLTLKITISLLFTFKNLLMINYVFKNLKIF